MALKLDITKAFDKVEWSFIEEVMKRVGFVDKWCHWIMKCITSVTYFVLINGCPSDKITPQRGIRQGDPISPYLYLLCTEWLTSLIHNLFQAGYLTGFKASRNGPPISHLLFADDSLIFCKAQPQQCYAILNTLKDYEAASGQAVNFQKSAITFGKGISKDIKDFIIRIMGIPKVGGFGKNLGLPEFIRRNKNDTFSYLAQRVIHKIENWYSNMLSPTGKEVLIIYGGSRDIFSLGHHLFVYNFIKNIMYISHYQNIKFVIKHK